MVSLHLSRAMSSTVPLSDLSKLRTVLSQAKNIVALTGAGVSAESGIPTFRGAGGFWRTYRSQDLASAGAFRRSPSLVWEFYHYRREVVFTKQPNKAHYALAEAEEKLNKQGRSLTVITQNIDELHQKAGSKNVVELHGSLFKTRCLDCGDVACNYESPICPALKDKGAPDADATDSEIPVDVLPHCKKTGCRGLLRPHIVWFGENLDLADLRRADDALSACDACLVIGTSSVVYPAAMYAPELAQRNVPVAEFNMESTPATHQFIVKGGESTKSSSSPHGTSGGGANTGSCGVGGGGSGSDGGSKEPPAKPSETQNLTKKQKLKLFMRDYGATVIVFHVGMSLTLLGGIYLVIKSGVDMAWVIQKLGISESNTDVAAGASTFVVAYAINKVLAPVRFSITFGCTPFIVRYLRRVGILKSVKP